jgi:Icc protein
MPSSLRGELQRRRWYRIAAPGEFRYASGVLLVQITDLHLNARPGPAAAGVDPGASLARGVAHLNGLDPRPDAVVISGDLVDLGTAEEYARLSDLLAPLAIPFYLMPGNHDHRDRLRQAFRAHGYLQDGEHVQYTVELAGVRLVMLDSLVPGSHAGELGPRRIAWLDATLADAPRVPTLVFVHHPPLVTGAPHVDRSRLLDAGRFGEAIARHPQVERVASGHVHRAMSARWAGTTVSTCPSLVHQFALDLRHDGAITPVDEGPGFQLHRWHAGHLITYTARMA